MLNLAMETFLIYAYIGYGIVSILNLILSLLYLYYGVRLANIYSSKTDEKDGIEIVERQFIHNRVFIQIFERF